jgi:hypothetical protein
MTPTAEGGTSCTSVHRIGGVAEPWGERAAFDGQAAFERDDLRVPFHDCIFRETSTNTVDCDPGVEDVEVWWRIHI